jgi:hypothetical protein
MTNEELEAKLSQLENQQAIQTQALRAALEARWVGGADTVAGYVQALDPQLALDPKVPLYD